MTRAARGGLPDLFAEAHRTAPDIAPLAAGAVLLRGFAATMAAAVMERLAILTAAAPFRTMLTPGGARMSVAMTNCGRAGWITDRRGYRYDEKDPLSGRPWPPLPPDFAALAARAAATAGYPDFAPDVCLVNKYVPGARMALHQDRDERDFSAPIVSLSLGLGAVFLFGGLRRRDRPQRLRLDSGDVVVWGGPSRLVFHGVAPLAAGDHPLTGACRINLTFRRAL